jgi:hypothetical protein
MFIEVQMNAVLFPIEQIQDRSLLGAYSPHETLKPLQILRHLQILQNMYTSLVSCGVSS